MKNNISKEALDLIMENASWERLGLSKPVVAKSEPKEKAKKVDESKEESEDHVCPLCQHELTEEISDDVLMAHVTQILEAVEESGILNESEDDEDADEDEDLEADEDEEFDEDEEVEEESDEEDED